MNAAQLERLGDHLTRLRLFKSRERLEALLQEAATKELAYADFLDQVLGEEVAAKTSKNVAMRTAMARFPFVKPLDSFDFGYQPSIDKKQLLQLANCHFIEHGDNILILGPPGVGKTHLCVALGLKAIEHGYRVLFTTAAQLIATLSKAHSEGRLDEKLKFYTTPRLLLIDEIGYLPIDRHGEPVLPAHQPPLRARADDPDQQPELRGLGRGVRRSRYRYRDPRPLVASRHHSQHPRQLVSLEGEAKGRSRSHRRGRFVNQVGKFRFPYLGKSGIPLTLLQSVESPVPVVVHAKQRLTSKGLRSFRMWKHARASLCASALIASARLAFAIFRS
jgi:DNA replication protein DnaC